MARSFRLKGNGSDVQSSQSCRSMGFTPERIPVGSLVGVPSPPTILGLAQHVIPRYRLTSAAKQESSVYAGRVRFRAEPKN